jgi:hypothetical protein
VREQILAPVIAWLDAGAPHTENRGMKFHMRALLHLDGPPEDLNWCGTACCIAGAIIAFNDPQAVVEGKNAYWYSVEALGLTPYQADDLFQPWCNDYRIKAEEITPARAATTLRHFVKTGDIVW